MTKTLNQIFFSLLQNQNIFFRKKTINGRSLNLFIEVLLLVRLNLFIEVLLLVRLNLLQVLLLVRLNLLQDFGTEIFLKKIHKSI